MVWCAWDVVTLRDSPQGKNYEVESILIIRNDNDDDADNNDDETEETEELHRRI